MAVVMAAMLVFSGCGKDTAVSGQGNDTFQGDEVSQGNESTAAATQSGGIDNAGSEEVTTIDYVFWGNQTEINTIMKTIDTFNASHTNIQVKGTGIDPSVCTRIFRWPRCAADIGDIVCRRDTNSLPGNWCRAGGNIDRPVLCDGSG